MVKFDSSKIDVEKRSYNISDLLESDFLLMDELPIVSEDSLGIIEAILLRIPLPTIHTCVTRKNTKYYLKPISCKKMLSIIKSFINGEISYSGKYFPEYNGQYWSEIPAYLQRRISETSLAFLNYDMGSLEIEIQEYIINRSNNYGS